MKKLISLLMLMLAIAVPAEVKAVELVWATYASENSIANAEALNETYQIDDHISISFEQNGASTMASYYTTGGLRLYKGNKMTITATGAKITSMVFTSVTGNNIFTPTEVTVGSFTSDSGTHTWTYADGAPSVTIEQGAVNSNNKQGRISKIEITYTVDGTPTGTVATPTFSPAAGTVSQGQVVTFGCETTGVTYHYTTNGNNPTTDSPSATSVTLNDAGNITVKVIAVKSGMSNSAVASATYTVSGGSNPDPTPTGNYEDFDFTSNTWSFPEGNANKTVGPASYPPDTPTITVAGNTGNGYYWSSDYNLLLGKTGAYIKLHAFSKDVEKIEVFYSSQSGTSASVNIFADDVAASTAHAAVKGGSWEYPIASNKQSAGTVYKVQITNANNAQFAKIRVYFKEGTPPAAKPGVPVAKHGENTITAGDTYTIPYGGQVDFIVDEGATLHVTANPEDNALIDEAGLMALIEDSCTLTYYASNDAGNSESATITLTVPHVATPVIGPDKSNITVAEKVSLSCSTEGASVYYTVDGSDPSTSDSRVAYTEPFALEKGEKTVKVFATKDGMMYATAERTYTVTQPFGENVKVTYNNMLSQWDKVYVTFKDVKAVDDDFNETDVTSTESRYQLARVGETDMWSFEGFVEFAPENGSLSADDYEAIIQKVQFTNGSANSVEYTYVTDGTYNPKAQYTTTSSWPSDDTNVSYTDNDGVVAWDLTSAPTKFRVRANKTTGTYIYLGNASIVDNDWTDATSYSAASNVVDNTVSATFTGEVLLSADFKNNKVQVFGEFTAPVVTPVPTITYNGEAVTGNTISVPVGGVITITGVEGSTIGVIATPGEGAEPTFSTNTATVTIQSACSLSIIATKNGVSSEPITLNVTIAAPTYPTYNVTYNNVQTKWPSVYVCFKDDNNDTGADNVTEFQAEQVVGHPNLYQFNAPVNFTWEPTKVYFSVGVPTSGNALAGSNVSHDFDFVNGKIYHPVAMYRTGVSGSNYTEAEADENGVVAFTDMAPSKGYSFRTYSGKNTYKYYHNVVIAQNDTWYTPATATSASSQTAITITPDYTGNVTIYLDLVNNLVKAVGTLNTPVVNTVATPTLTAESTSAYVDETISVTPSCTTEGVTYYYTLNGNTPTTSSTQMTGTSIAVTSDTPGTVTLNVIAVKEGMTNSDVATATYTFTAAPAGDTNCDVLTTTSLGLSGNTYDDFDSGTDFANARYYGNANVSSGIGLKATQKGTGSNIAGTGSAVNYIGIFASASSDGRVVDKIDFKTVKNGANKGSRNYLIYGSATAFDATQGVGTLKSLGSIEVPASTTDGVYQYPFSTGYAHIAILADAALGAQEIDVTWKDGTPVSPGTLTVDTPVLTPSATTATVGDNITVQVNCPTSGATCYYTTNGVDPTADSTPVIDGTITVSSATPGPVTLKVIAIKEGMNNSSIASATFTFEAATVSADFVLLTNIAHLNDGDEVIFTNNANTQVFSSAAFNGNRGDQIAGTVNTSVTPNTYPYKEGYEVFTVGKTGTGSNAEFTFYVPGKGYLSAVVASGTNATNLQYLSTADASKSKAKIEEITPSNMVKLKFNISESGRYLIWSSNVFGLYIANNLHIWHRSASAPAAPAFNPAAGSVANGTQVTITASGAQSIYYTLDGSEPCVDGNPATGAVLYTGSVRLVNPSSTAPTNITLKACAVNSVGASDVTSATYTVAAPAPVIPVEFSPAQGEVALGTVVELNADGATTLLYRTGTSGEWISIPLTGVVDVKVTINAATTIQAKTINSEGTESPVYTAVYTIPVPQAPLTLSPSGGAVDYGTVVTISCADASHIKYQIDDNEPVTVEGTSASITLNYNGKVVNVKAWPMLNGAAGAMVETSYNVGGAPGVYYQLVTDLADIQEGDDYIFVAKHTAKGESEKTYAMGTIAMDYGAAVDVTERVDDGGLIILPPDSQVVPFHFEEAATPENAAEADQDKQFYELLTADGYIYCAGGTNPNMSVRNDLLTPACVVINGTSHVATVNFGLNTTGAGVTSDGTRVTRTMRFNYNNGNTPRFKPYSSGQTDVYLYRMIYNSNALPPIISVEGKRVGSDIVPLSEGDYSVKSSVTTYHVPVVATVSTRLEGEKVNYSTDGSVWTTDAASPVEVDVNAPMVVYAYTSADGKFNSQTVDHQFNLAPAVPTVTKAYNDADNTYTVSFACITPDVEIQYSLEGGAWTSYSAPFVVSERGTNALAFKAVSSAWSNESAEGHYIVTVGNPDPFTLVTNANQLQPGDEIIIVNKNASTLYPGHDENNPVAKFYAMGAYQTGGSFFNGYDLSGKGLAPVEKDGKMQILLSPNQTEVEVFTLEVAQSESGTWYLRGNSAAAADKYLYDPGTVGDRKNNLIVKNVKAGRSTATITITTDGNAVATIRFDNPSEENNVLFYTASDATPRFGAYTVNNAENDRYKIQVYRRGDNHIRVARPTVSLPEGFYTADELAAINASGGITLACETEGATIYYTTDGTNPYEFGVPYVADTPIPVSEGTMIAAFADVDNDDTYKRSYELICVYHVFSGNKKYRRVTADEVQTLAPGEEVIVVATNGTKYYALGRHQLLDADTDNTFRAAVELNGAVEDGIVTITQAEVQPIILVSGKYDAYEAFNWRLYTNGSYFNQITDSRHYDGYLYSGGDNASLATMRIEDTEDIYMANADVRFLQYSLAGDQLNLHGGVSVQFGSPDGNEERYPNYLSLHHVGEGEWHFDVSRLDDILNPPAGTERYAVSLFRLYDDSQMLQPTFSVPSGRIGDNEKITISSPENGAVIYYSLDGEHFTEYNENEPIVLERSVNGQPRSIWTYAEDAFGVRDNSLVNRQDYIVVGMTLYELVTKVEDIHINDRIIMVNATPFTRDGGRYYAFSNRRNHGDNPYYYGTEIDEAIPQEGRNHLLQLEEGSDIVVFKVEMHQNNEAFANRPYLFNVVNSGTHLEDGLEPGDGYVKTINLKDISIGAALPPTIGERSQYSAHISIADAEDYTSFDTGGEKGIVPAVAKIAFVNDQAGIYNYIRFNAASGSRPHFNAYGTSYDVDNYTFNPDEIVYNASTWPVHIYRALAKVDNPSITAYEAQVDFNNRVTDPREYTYPTVGASGDQEVFHNAVKLVVRQSARTAYGADLLYHWGESKTVHPVTSDYKTLAEANTFTVYLDGYGHYTTVDGDPFSAALMAEIMKYTEATPVIRAIAGIEDENGEYVVSRPSLRELHFETTPPILRANNAEGNVVLVSRPHTYTLNATLHYTTNGTLPTADSPTVTPESTITLNSGETLIVGAFKDGYTPTFTTYSAYNHYADPRPMQLLELTPAGEDELGIQAATDGSKHYLTFRTDRNLNFYLVTYNATTGEYSVEDTDNDKARALVGNAGEPTNYKYLWTPMFYVMAYNATDDAFPFDKLDPETELVVKVKDGSRTFSTMPHNVTIASQGDADKTYYGCVIDRNGIIGQRSMNISLDYQIDGTPYHTEQIVLVTPTMPNPVHGYYRFQYHQYSVADGYPEQNMRRLFPGKEFLKVQVPSAVKGQYTDGVFKPDMCDVLLPIDDVDPRQLDCVIAFYRPNISNDVLRHYDIQYTVEFTNSLGENLPGDGIFADKDVFSASSNGVYAFAIDRIHPRKAVYPILRVLGTEYVQNEEASDAYGSYTADWGYREDGTLGTPNEESPTVTGIEIEAVNHSEMGETSMGKVFISQLTGEMTDFYGRHAKEGKRDWIYNGHTEFVDEGDVIFDPSKADLDKTGYFAENGELEGGKKVVNARFYHLETYVPATAGAPAEYASYQYLVQHKEGHLDDVPAWSQGIVTDLCQWGDTDPLVGTYIATDFTSDQTPTVKVTPVYLFWRTPEAVEGGDNKTPKSTTTLEFIKAIDRTPAPAPAVALRSARANTLDDDAAPATGNAPQLYAHNGDTDMNHSSIADLTDDNRFVVVKTESTAQQAEVPVNEWGGIPTGVEEVAIDALNADAEFFTLQGIRVEHPAPGNVYIVRQGTSTLKVLVK